MADPVATLRRLDKLRSNRVLWESAWRRAAELVQPEISVYLSPQQDGADRTVRLYDSYPSQALNQFVAALDAGVTPGSQVWFKPTTGDADVDEEPEVARDLDTLKMALWQEINRPRGTFAAARLAAWRSIGVIGSGAILIDPSADGRACEMRALPISNTWFAFDSYRRPQSGFHTMKLSAEQYVADFGDAAPDAVKKAYDKTPDQEFETLWHCAPRGHRPAGRFDAAGSKFEETYIDVATKTVLRTGGRDGLPVVLGRYSLADGECYGRSPALAAMPDLKLLNVIKWSVIEQANMIVDPPLLTSDDAVLSEFDLTPGTRIPGGVSQEGRQMVVPLQAAGNLGAGLEMVEATRRQIDDAFLGLYFRALVENPQMTATQAMLLSQQQGQVLAPPVNAIMSDMLDPLLRRVASIMFQQGRLPEMSGRTLEVIRRRGSGLGIELTGPLAVAARMADGIAVSRTFEAVAPLAQIDPAVIRRIDAGEALSVLARANGTPARVLKSDEQVAEEDAAAAQQQQMAQVLEAAPVAAQTAKTMAEAQALSQAAPNVPRV